MIPYNYNRCLRDNRSGRTSELLMGKIRWLFLDDAGGVDVGAVDGAEGAPLVLPV